VLAGRLARDVATLGEDAGKAAPLLSQLDAERAASRSAVVEALSSDRYLALLDRLDHVSEPEPAASGRQPASLTVLLRAEWKRTRKAVSRLGPGSSDEELHAARIRVKRARYAAELAAHELGRSGARFVGRSKTLQEILGEHQDATVAGDRLCAWGDAEQTDAASRLIALEEERKREARAAWPDAWSALRRAGKRIE
jgi:CHAD domain-containing protein